MPDIKPFRGLLYDPLKTAFSDVVAPPYDVISPQMQSALYERSPYNVVRLVLGKEENPYASAAAYFQSWRKQGIIIQDDTPSLYILSQHFTLADGKSYERKGFIAACRLEEFGNGSIYPHEKTHSGPKEDRFKLFQSTGSMFSQIFSIYGDPKFHLEEILHSAMQQEPLADLDIQGVRQRLWRLKNAEHIATIARHISTQRVFVADGHHRYETALLYRSTMSRLNENATGREAYQYVPMFFTNMNDPGLVILATHRLVHSISDFDRSALIDRLQAHFTVEHCSTMEQLAERMSRSSGGGFGLVLRDAPQFLFLQYTDVSTMSELGIPDILAQLDTTILHTMVFKRILLMTDEDQLKKSFLDYESDTARAVATVMDGRAQAAFLMNPTRVEHVRAVAEAGFTMPQKSTYFYPKLLSGLVMYSFAGELD